MNCRSNVKLNLRVCEWQPKLNVNVLVGLCTCWNIHQAARVSADYWCSVHVPRLWPANTERKTHVHMHHFKNLHCAASILRQQTVQHKSIIIDTQKSELRGPDSSPQGGKFPFKAKRTIMKLRYFLQEWRTHPPFQQGAQDLSESITFVLMLQRIYIGVLCCYAVTSLSAAHAFGVLRNYSV